MYRLILLILPLCCFGCCLRDSADFRYPNLLHPGHISEQQAWAERFDPFLSSEMGPKIVGDRPSSALDPTPAVQRTGR